MPFVCFVTYFQGFPPLPLLDLFFLVSVSIIVAWLCFVGREGVCLFCLDPSGVKSQEGPSGQFPIGPLGGW